MFSLKNNGLVFSILASLISQILFPINAKAQMPIKVTIDNWPPYETVELNKNNKPAKFKGSSVEITQEVLKRLNLDATWQVRPWARGQLELLNKDIDILLSGRWNPERAQNFYFPDKPIGSISWQVYTHNLNMSFKNGLLGRIDSYSYPVELESLFNPINFVDNIPDNINLLRMVQRKRIDFAILDKINANNLESQYGIELNPVRETLFYSPLYPLIRNDWKHKEEFNDMLNQMHLDGTIKKILQKYSLPYLPDLPKQGKFAHQLN